MSVDIKDRKFLVEVLCADDKFLNIKIDGATLICILVNWLEEFPDVQAAVKNEAAVVERLQRYIAAWADDDA